MPTFLPEPAWTADLKRCPACGYSLDGLPPLSPCPECGTVPPREAFVVYGVPKGIVGASKRYTVVAIGLAVLLGVALQFWPLFVFAFGMVGLLGFLATVVIVVVALFVLGRGKQSGTTRFVFVPGGAYYEPVKENIGARMSAERFLRWTGAEWITLQRVGPFWRKLRIDLGPKSPVLEAGIRCTDEAEESVRRALEESIAAAVAAPKAPAYSSSAMNPAGATTTTRDDSTA